MNERETFEHLVARYGATRARHLLGALRLLTLYEEGEVRRRGWIVDELAADGIPVPLSQPLTLSTSP